MENKFDQCNGFIQFLKDKEKTPLNANLTQLLLMLSREMSDVWVII